ncbi:MULTISPECIES: phosphotransferase [unclassified Candidatus Tisiphia]|uniref:phosphotransferase n=1 Tax=unclassified Candidatus Tisiphia TaxID=2996318 RepID=UPI003CCB685C
MIFKSLYSLIFIFLFCAESKADCFIAKENNTILKEEGVCSQFYPFMKTSPEEQIVFLEQLNNTSLHINEKSGRYNNDNLLAEEFIEGWELYGKTSEGFFSINKSYHVGCFSGWARKGERKIIFVNYIEDDEKFNSSAAKRAKERAKEYLRPLVTEEFGYNELLKKVPNIFIAPIKEVVSKSFSQKEIDNIKFKKVFGGLSQAKLFQINNKYVLRLLDENKEIEIRESEISAHKIGSKLKIAPTLICSDTLSLVSIMEFIEGRTMSTKDLKNAIIIEKIMANLKKFHNYLGNNNLLKKTKLDTIKNSYKSFSEKGAVYPTGYTESYRKLIQDFAKFDRPFLPSHGDLNQGNILITKDGNIYFIDWSEARVDNPLLDIGWLASCLGANLSETKNLLRKYFGREPTAFEFKEVLYFKNVTNFWAATFFIGRQEEREQYKMDLILKTLSKKSSEYRREGITAQEFTNMKGYDLTTYALSWFKEFVDNQSYIESIDEK